MKIIVMGGSFNPPTVAHQRLLLAAVNEFEADLGLFIPSSYEYVKKKMQKAGIGKETLSEAVRLEMLSAMVEDDPRLGVSDLEYHRTEKGCTFDTLEAVSSLYPEATVLFLSGGDKVDIFPRWHKIEEFLQKYQIIVVKRDGDDPQSELAADPFLRLYPSSFLMMDAPQGLEGISSSAIRNCLRAGDDSAKALCHPRVWEILQRQGGMSGSVICGFFEEYRFLSNFWLAPVEYGGLVYSCNESAFQAQKCITEEEKRSFTELGPKKAKEMGRRVSLRPDWEAVKCQMMEEIVRAKFTQNRELKAKLLATYPCTLEEGNTWKDTFWGVDLRTGEGQNHLGKILMKIREELMAQA